MLRAAATSVRAVHQRAQASFLVCRSFATAPPSKPGQQAPRRAPPKRQEKVKPADGAPVHKPAAATPAAAVTPAAPASSTTVSNTSSSTSSGSSNFSGSESSMPGLNEAMNDPQMASMFKDPAMRARLADPNTMSQLQSLLSDPKKMAQMESMMSNPLIRRGLAAMNPEIAAQLADPTARAQMMRQAQELAKNPQQIEQLRQAMQSKAQAAQEAETPKPTPPPTPKPALMPKPAAAPKPKPVAAAPAAPAASAAPTSGLPALDPLVASQLSDPSVRARLSALLSNPAQLDGLLADPLARQMLAKAAGAQAGPAAEQLVKAMENKESRQQLISKLQEVGQLKGGIDSIIANASAKQAAAQAASAAATPAAPLGGGGGAAGSPPPPLPPSAAEEDPDVLGLGEGATGGATGSGQKSGGPRTLGWWVDLVLGLLAGYLLFEVARFLLDRPVVLDSIVEAAEEDELFALKVGTPAKLRWMPWTGNVEEGQSAAVVLPVSGPNGKGTLHARALWDAYSKSWKLMLLQLADIDGPESAQKHSLIIPDRFVIKPRYVSPEEAERIRKKYEDMQAKMEKLHGNKDGNSVMPAQPPKQ